MKVLILLTITFFLASCNEEAPSHSPKATSKGFVEENDMCICTKEFMPVCGSDGVTYGNKCLAGCAKVSSTPGACEEQKEAESEEE